MAQRVVDQTISIEDLEKQEKEQAAKAQKASKKKKDAEVEVEREDASESESNDEVVEKKSKKADKEVEKKAKKSTFSKSKNKAKRGKNYKEAKKNAPVDEVSLGEAIKTVRKLAYANFNESVELHVNLGTDKGDNDQKIRFTTVLPHGTGKSVNILVISDKNTGKAENVIYRDSTVVDEILKNKFVPGKDFDMVVVTPNAMKDLAKAAKILGPRGMMPSPKTETVTENVEQAVKNLSQGRVEVKSQPNHSIVHQMVGTLKFSDKDLEENISALLRELNLNKPTKTKGKLIKKVTISTTMGVGVKVKS